MNWQFLTDYWRQITAGIAALAGGVMVWKGDQLVPWLKSIWSYLTDSKPVAPVVVEDDDGLDVKAFKRLQARFTRLKCPEGTTAMQVVGQHFFHEGSA